MSLSVIVDNQRTDKNTLHSYLDLYEELLFSKKETAKNVLEVGVCLLGGSIKLWYDYFKNATVYGLDTKPTELMMDDIKSKDRIILYNSIDAYNEDFFNSHFFNKNIKFDFLLDDGSHRLEDMKKFVNLYTKVMADDGILIIEDVADINWLNEIINEVPENLKPYIKTYDFRHVKGRYDDIVFVIDKNVQR